MAYGLSMNVSAATRAAGRESFRTRSRKNIAMPAEQEIDDIPRPPPVQIEQVKNLLNVFLDII